jgi:hypothetical protein
MRLARAPSSRCPHCGRVTKTVDGVCADCWGPKEARARRFAFRRTQGSPGATDDDPISCCLSGILGFVFALAAAAAIVAAILI